MTEEVLVGGTCGRGSGHGEGGVGQTEWQGGWLRHDPSKTRFLAVGSCEQVVKAAAMACFVLMDGVVLRVVCWWHLRLVRVPLNHCNEAGGSKLVGSLRAIVASTVGLATGGEMMVFEMLVRVSGALAMPRGLIVQIGGDVFPVSTHLQPFVQAWPVRE